MTASCLNKRRNRLRALYAENRQVSIKPVAKSIVQAGIFELVFGKYVGSTVQEVTDNLDLSNTEK